MVFDCRVQTAVPLVMCCVCWSSSLRLGCPSWSSSSFLLLHSASTNTCVVFWHLSFWNRPTNCVFNFKAEWVLTKSWIWVWSLELVPLLESNRDSARAQRSSFSKEAIQPVNVRLRASSAMHTGQCLPLFVSPSWSWLACAHSIQHPYAFLS